MNGSFYAEFASPEDTLAAAEHLRELGYTRLSAFTPFHMPELEETLGVRRSKLPIGVFLAGVTGTATAYGIIWYTNAHDYPLNVGGRPLDSVPADIPIMFETTVLFAGIAAFILALVLNGLPRLYDAFSEIDGFERTTVDRFWIRIDTSDPRFDPDVRRELERFGLVGVHAVEMAP